MFNNMDYKKILEIKEINFEFLDKNTLVSYDAAFLNNSGDSEDEQVWLVIEVWLDKNNTIKLMASDGEESYEILDLNEDYLNFITSKINEAINKINS